MPHARNKRRQMKDAVRLIQRTITFVEATLPMRDDYGFQEREEAVWQSDLMACVQPRSLTQATGDDVPVKR